MADSGEDTQGMAHAARIMVVERWAILRRGLVGLLHASHTVVGQLDDARDLAQAVDAAPELDLVVVGDALDVELPAVVADVRRRRPGTQVMVLCDHVDRAGLQALLRAGAGAVLSKKVDDDRLLDDIERLLCGDRVIDQQFLPLLFGTDELGEVPSDRSLLTTREREVLTHLARGASNRQIAEALLVGESTVKSHLARIYEKLDVDGRYRAVGRAVELGLLS